MKTVKFFYNEQTGKIMGLSVIVTDEFKAYPYVELPFEEGKDYLTGLKSIDNLIVDKGKLTTKELVTNDTSFPFVEAKKDIDTYDVEIVKQDNHYLLCNYTQDLITMYVAKTLYQVLESIILYPQEQKRITRYPFNVTFLTENNIRVKVNEEA